MVRARGGEGEREGARGGARGGGGRTHVMIG
jgi:hypothetical protein